MAKIDDKWERIFKKIQLILEKNQKLTAANTTLESQVLTLENKISELNKEKESLKEQIQYIKAAKEDDDDEEEDDEDQRGDRPEQLELRVVLGGLRLHALLAPVLHRERDRGHRDDDGEHEREVVGEVVEPVDFGGAGRHGWRQLEAFLGYNHRSFSGA